MNGDEEVHLTAYRGLIHLVVRGPDDSSWSVASCGDSIDTEADGTLPSAELDAAPLTLSELCPSCFERTGDMARRVKS